ncbi:hypothetical protein EVAR_90876_1 [Eumeta japonica]|uniref:Uncharacterized protein n=1 Tax=Eumeta variegata TaxID=151549 RepID=A0A4C2ABJ3_EUMVA|nr:hypothetical protein EVAR_90876_1 [Eumeta japonica]
MPIAQEILERRSPSPGAVLGNFSELPKWICFDEPVNRHKCFTSVRICSGDLLAQEGNSLPISPGESIAPHATFNAPVVKKTNGSQTGNGLKGQCISAFHFKRVCHLGFEQRHQIRQPTASPPVTQDDLRSFEDRILNSIERRVSVQPQLHGIRTPPQNKQFAYPDLSQPPPTFRTRENQQFSTQPWTNPNTRSQARRHPNITTQAHYAGNNNWDRII